MRHIHAETAYKTLHL